MRNKMKNENHRSWISIFYFKKEKKKKKREMEHEFSIKMHFTNPKWLTKGPFGICV